MSSSPPSARTRVKRVHERAAYDRATLHAVLDAGMICHVGYAFDGYPVVTPTLYWREGDAIYWHGSSASRALKASQDLEVCLTVTHIDGLVLARSAFHHSANYRSAMIFGTARLVTGDSEKLARLRAMMDTLYPGRWDALRPVSEQELKATRILWMPLDEASVKIRTGAPIDDEEDMADNVWAGVVPFRIGFDTPVPDPTTEAAGRQAPDVTDRLTTS
ncbi:pyridoxamine 5'-phosphate oxidase family protein [Rhizorhabdus dicambivorans]|uniref:Pyridoxamine 5'-phosphate oxidase family protein n=1 Tax=Rhizorhabdus dicambivorans TaxID=1850238 RepID=A0A2A4FWT9_9SPHN|nr:pyridoxamine 5'-phosphate oxidase family protein [Rhizorhabdus dicambivorans]ATE65565.1 pyridoxamine 5'-phosphate oxidase family protein [Rhizorhabdus dicambivorans]PCE41908.1 pyridoxamine 5'-phosphate oxidase family protein [Rhizorhabdus dicambivorans]